MVFVADNFSKCSSTDFFSIVISSLFNSRVALLKYLLSTASLLFCHFFLSFSFYAISWLTIKRFCTLFASKYISGLVSHAVVWIEVVSLLFRCLGFLEHANNFFFMGEEDRFVPANKRMKKSNVLSYFSLF